MLSIQLHRLLFAHVLAPLLPWSSHPLADFSFSLVIFRSLSIQHGFPQLHLRSLVGNALYWHRMFRISPTRVCPPPSPPRLALDPDCPLPTPPDVFELLRSSFKKSRGNIAGWRPLTQCFLCFTITTILPYHYLNLSHLLIDMCSLQPILMASQASTVTPTPCHHHHAYVMTEPLSRLGHRNVMGDAPWRR